MKVECPICGSFQINEVDRPQIDAPNQFYIPCNCRVCGADFDVVLAVSCIRTLLDLEIAPPPEGDRAFPELWV